MCDEVRVGITATQVDGVQCESLEMSMLVRVSEMSMLVRVLDGWCGQTKKSKLIDVMNQRPGD